MSRNVRPIVTRWGPFVGIPSELSTELAATMLVVVLSAQYGGTDDTEYVRDCLEVMWEDGGAALETLKTMDPAAKADEFLQEYNHETERRDAIVDFLTYLKQAAPSWSTHLDNGVLILWLDS